MTNPKRQSGKVLSALLALIAGFIIAIALFWGVLEILPKQFVNTQQEYSEDVSRFN